MTRIVLVAAYLIGLVIALFSMNADPGGSWGTICLGISILLGAGTGDFRLAALSLLAIPLTIPFGLPADETGDPVLPLWVGGMMFAFTSSVLIVLAALIRKIAESRLRRRRAARDPGIT